MVLTLSPGILPGLAALLRARGIAVRRAPLLVLMPPEDWRAMDDAMARIPEYDAVVVTSPRAARAIAARAAARVRRTSGLPPFWATGGRIAGELRRLGVTVRVAAPSRGEGHAAALARSMIAAGVRSPVLYPCGDRRRDEVSSGLRAAGVDVHEVPAYRSVPASPAAARSACRGADLLVVGSPSVAALIATAVERRPPFVALGATTARSAAALGWTPLAVARTPTTPDVAHAVTGLLRTLPAAVHPLRRAPPSPIFPAR